MPYSGTPEEVKRKQAEYHRARLLAKNPDAGQHFYGTPEERYESLF